MARTWKARPAPPPTSITEICKRYVATAWSLSKAMGLPLTETFIRDHHQAIATCYIEVSRCELRLPPGVTLPSLATAGGPHGPPQAAETPGPEAADGPQGPPTPGANGQPATPLAPPDAPDAHASPGGEGHPREALVPPVTSDAHDTSDADASTQPEPPLPTTIPVDGDLPCRGAEIGRLKPGQLAMVVNRVASLVHSEGAAWVPLLAALQGERGRRLEAGRRPKPTLVPVEDDDHGG